MDRLGQEIERELRRFGPAAGMAKLVAGWPAAVGPAIARHAWPARFARDNTLVVHTTDAVWAFELGQQAGEIARRLGDLAPAGVRFVAGALPEPEADEDREMPRPRALTEDETARAAAWAAPVEDPELREAVVRAARASLAAAGAHPRSDRSF